MRLPYQVVAVLLVFGVACSSDMSAPGPRPVDHDVQGSWGENTNGAFFPGNSFLVALSESGGAIVGTGTYAGEAGPRGALAVSGTVANDSVRLAIVYIADPTLFPQLKPDTAHFVGVLTSHDRIDGNLTRAGFANPFGLVRLVVGAP